MFQNIKEGQAKGKHRGAGVFANVFSIQNIPLYIISFMTSIVGVGTGGQVSPFGISMMAACMGNSVPILGVVLAGILGNAIGFGLEGAITYLVISIVFVLSTFIIKPLYQEEEKNEFDILCFNSFKVIGKMGLVKRQGNRSYFSKNKLYCGDEIKDELISASIKVIYSPLARLIPSILALTDPSFFLFIKVTLLSYLYSLQIFILESVDPSFININSNSLKV